MTDFMEIVNAAILWNCRTLSVPVPSVRIVEPSELATPTTHCAVSSDGGELLINRNFAQGGDTNETFIWLALSHECRHIWQAFHANLFNGYRDSSALSVQEYNRQAAEIDAWAWGVIVLTKRFHVRPTLEKNFGAEAWAFIEDRARQISEEGLF